jgi:hypothetical protein
MLPEKNMEQLIDQLQLCYKRAYVIYKPQVEALITRRIQDENTIQHLLDGLLDSCADRKILLLFKRVCRYYWDINPQATADYVQTYRNLWDSDD